MWNLIMEFNTLLDRFAADCFETSVEATFNTNKGRNNAE